MLSSDVFRTKRVFELYIGDPYKTAEESELFESSDEEELIPSSPVSHSPSTNHTPEQTEASPLSQESPSGRESLRLSLPTADDDYDIADEMDTERFGTFSNF